jgi:hypothetical protein
MTTVALVDFHTAGHHFAFIRLFAKYLLKNNYRVCLIYPEKCSEIKSYLIENGASRDMVFYDEASITKREVKGLGRFSHAYATLQLWLDTKTVLKRAEENSGLKIDFVFFAWLDDFLSNYLPHQLVDLTFPFSWAGLYFHPLYLFRDVGDRVSFSSVDSVLLSKRCRWVAIHDEFLLERMKRRVRKEVRLFPEIADATPPDNDFHLAKTLREKANGRIVISLIGLEKRKGVLYFNALFQRADPTKYFFFLAGKLSRGTYNEQEYESVKEFVNIGTHNFLYHPDFIQEGRDINSVIQSSDILFLVYDNFKSSSNFNTKAAHFKKFVLATDSYWIGSVTRKYNLGEVAKEGDVESMLAGLEQLARDIAQGTRKPLYNEYLAHHKEENLLASMQIES